MSWDFDNKSLKFILFLARLQKPKQILEIGTYMGNTSKALARAFPESQVTTIEKDHIFYSQANENITEKNIRLIHGNAKEVMPDIETKFDLIFIDAMKKQYLAYLEILEKKQLINKNCIIVADNVISHKEKMQEYLDYVKKNYDSITIPIGDGLEVSK